MTPIPGPTEPPRATRAPEPGTDEAAALSPNVELARKSIHVALSSTAAILVLALPAERARTLFAAVAALAVALDVARLASPRWRDLFIRAFGPMFRASERDRVSGAATLATGFALAVWLFDPGTAAAAILYAGLADAAAAVIGRRFGRHRVRGGRSIEGALAFAVVAFAVAALVAGLRPGPAAGVALLLALVELMPLPVHDNLLLPVVGGWLTRIFP